MMQQTNHLEEMKTAKKYIQPQIRVRSLEPLMDGTGFNIGSAQEATGGEEHYAKEGSFTPVNEEPDIDNSQANVWE